MAGTIYVQYVTSHMAITACTKSTWRLHCALGIRHLEADELHVKDDRLRIQVNGAQYACNTSLYTITLSSTLHYYTDRPTLIKYGVASYSVTVMLFIILDITLSLP